MGTHNHRGLSDTGMRGESVTTLFTTSPSKTASRPSSRCPQGTKKDPPDKCLEGQAEPVGLEPTHPHGRQFSRLVQYQLCDGSKRRNTVGAPGFEPGTSASRTQRSTELSHAPKSTINRPKAAFLRDAWAIVHQNEVGAIETERIPTSPSVAYNSPADGVGFEPTKVLTHTISNRAP